MSTGIFLISYGIFLSRVLMGEKTNIHGDQRVEGDIKLLNTCIIVHHSEQFQTTNKPIQL